MKRSGLSRTIVAIAMMLIGWLHLLADDLAKTTNFFTMDQVMLTNPETDQYGNSYVNGFTYNSLVVSMSKQSGPSKPLYNNNNKQICLYATGTMTLSTTDGTMLEKVVFKIPPGNGNGQQNLASITASEGVVTLDNTAWTVTWSGSTSEVTLTVGAKSDWGTEYGKSGCFVVSVMEVTSIKHKIGISFGQTVLLDETFDNNDYNKSFPLVWDGDGLAPHSSISSLFLSASTGSYQPWWILRDSNTSPNMYYGSHSMYTEPGKSNDWMISVPVKIEEAGFVLSFDAQSYCMYMDESKQSSVSLYITDYMTDNPADLPKTPVKVFENIPQGASDAVDGEFTRYSYGLDDYVGKTIYVCFVNENYDKHILCLDNIKISREEVGSIAVVAPDHVTEEMALINVTLSANTDKDLKNWTVTYDDGVTTLTESGELLQSMSSYEFTFEVPITKGEQRDYTITLTADDMPASKVTGSVACYAFVPFRKVLIEEMTGTWCGYCPAGAYNIDSMLADEEMKEYVVPVAVHTTPSMDPMVIEEYDKAMSDLYGNSAPLFVFNRRDVRQINASYDTKFDKDNSGSLAYAVRQVHAEPTPVEVKVTGEYIIEENDTIAIKARAAFRSAVPVKKEKYVLSFILVENNVWMPIDAGSWWAQSNYYSAQSGETSYEGDLGGWAYCKSRQEDVRYNDVARGIYDFYGIQNSLPNEMTMGTEYVYEYTINIPDTEVTNANGKVMRPAIKRDYCELICFVVDVETGEVMNCDKYPMSEVAEHRYTVADLVRDKNLSVDSITLSEDGEVIYYDMQGRRVVNPENGIYIRKQGSTATKVVVK